MVSSIAVSTRSARASHAGGFDSRPAAPGARGRCAAVSAVTAADARETATQTARGCHLVAKPVGWVRGEPDHLRRRPGRRRGDVHRLPRVHQPEPGQREHPGKGARRRDRAGLPPQPPRPRPALGPPPHRLHGGLRHHQPALLRADPRGRAAGQGLGVHARPGQRRGVVPDRVGAGPAAGALGRRLRPRRQPASRRQPSSDRRAATGGADEPRAAGARQRGAGPCPWAVTRWSSTSPPSATPSCSTSPVHATPGWRRRGGVPCARPPRRSAWRRVASARSPPRSPRAARPRTAR